MLGPQFSAAEGEPQSAAPEYGTHSLDASGRTQEPEKKGGGGRVCYGRQLQNRVIKGVEYAEEKKEQGNSAGFMKVRHKKTSKTDTWACFEEGRKQSLASKM